MRVQHSETPVLGFLCRTPGVPFTKIQCGLDPHAHGPIPLDSQPSSLSYAVCLTLDRVIPVPWEAGAKLTEGLRQVPARPGFGHSRKTNKSTGGLAES